ncbi:hypothetical protein PC129_g10831 [Phytophthora cactorum]|uniref:Uncharacterized protein n=1 Tax=Phytophthora cactorum TaxID=29920 RepID=A0A8T1D7S7_9STRA|nr:hypothetical protein Pcac1_g14579 [Phytophthora cactorum]KAG2903464.1 hypothetical protein PC114_g12261 [Phytophthora cactorum]KAG2935329.1 hypothetical protein PC117_g12456 [Phytophthora cactorum]KAG3011534.1 hypothetical protein PC119_g13196 [Phytophthora cactorum]KAG3032149.1 hypothetical protein PC120_g2632 [Phytophthora cactorum]
MATEVSTPISRMNPFESKRSPKLIAGKCESKALVAAAPNSDSHRVCLDKSQCLKELSTRLAPFWSGEPAQKLPVITSSARSAIIVESQHENASSCCIVRVQERKTLIPSGNWFAIQSTRPGCSMELEDGQQIRGSHAATLIKKQ